MKEPVKAYDKEGRGGLGFDQFPDGRPLQWNLQGHFTSIGKFDPNSSPLANIILAQSSKHTLQSEEDTADVNISALFQTLELPGKPHESQTARELTAKPHEGQTVAAKPHEGQTAKELPVKPHEGQTANHRHHC